MTFPSEFEEQSKTGMVDVSILWDSKELVWLSRLFGVLRVGNPKDRLWPFRYQEVLETVKKAGQELEMPWMVPYTLRHAGVSWDVLQRFRTLEEAQRRGQWRCPLTMERYEQHARVGRGSLEISVGTREHDQRCQSQLSAVLLGRLPPLAPPRL